MSVKEVCGVNDDYSSINLTGKDAKECAKKIKELVKTNEQVGELRDEYKKLKRAYTPLNLLMERARQIPLESVWPPVARAPAVPTPLQEELRQIVQAEIQRHEQDKHSK